jgi:S-phase kinase-associated protein 1
VSSNEEAKIAITKEWALMSKLVSNILEGDSDADKIQVKQVDGATLQLIVDYLNHHQGKEPAEIAKPIRSVKMEKIVEDPWDATFINKLAKRSLFQLILGANYMDCKSLLHLGCAKVATMIKGKSPEEIKQILGEEDEQN